MAEQQEATKKTGSSKKEKFADWDAIRSGAVRFAAYAAMMFVGGIATAAGAKTFQTLAGSFKGGRLDGIDEENVISMSRHAM